MKKNDEEITLDVAATIIDGRTLVPARAIAEAYGVDNIVQLVDDGEWTIDKLIEGKTTLMIAHRLSTVRNSDVIMVLEQGRIIERGSHEKLIEEKGKYYQLYTGAFELE